MLSCEKATYMLSQAQHEKLSPIKRLRLRIHLLTCDGCIQFGKQITFLSEAFEKLKKKAEEAKIDEKYKVDIQNDIDSFIKNNKKD